MKKKRLLESRLIKEDELGLEEITNSMEESYLKSCAHNGTVPEDHEYFRSYIWCIFAILKKQIDAKRK